MITRLEEFRAYNHSLEVAEEMWGIVEKWSYFAKETLGKQMIRAVDSIAANLSEGLGRYHFRETKNFAYYSLGSLFETKTWLDKAYKRNLVSEEQFRKLMDKLDIIGRMINTYIHSIGDFREPNT